MTDGIIREVFNRYCLSLVKNEQDGKAFDSMEQELIEKIKQESDVYQSEISDYKDAISLDKLIGDNQE